MRPTIDLVVACDLNRGIGRDNALPWRIPGDMKYFKELTSTSASSELYNAVVMGRKTWESIPPNMRPLAERYNVVLTRNPNYQVPPGVFKFPDLDQALAYLETGPVDRCFIIGGAEVYRQAMEHPRCNLLYVTEVRSTFECDAFLPDFKKIFNLVSSSEIQKESGTGIEYCFKIYQIV